MANKRFILLVDDSKFLRRANEMALTKAGYGVLSAADGEEGLRVARENVPDLVVLDMMLPKMPGPQLLEALKKDPKTAHIPVVVLSSLPQKNEEKLKNDGATAYFEKSALGVDNSSSALVRAIDDVLRSSKAAAGAGGMRR